MSDFFPGASWAYAEPNQAEILKEELSRPLHERLMREADAEQRRGDQFRGCSWLGPEHPSASYYRRASMLRQAALEFQAKQAKKRPKK